MKKLLSITIIATVILMSCSKSNDTVTHINCDGLVTDTLGTGDNAAIYMPNAFSPNGDGLNDVIRPITKNCSSVEFSVYDDNNNVVYNTNQLLHSWNPVTPANTSIKYYYRIQVVTFANHHIGQCGELYKLTCFPASVPRSTLFFEDQLTQAGFFIGNSMETMPACL